MDKMLGDCKAVIEFSQYRAFGHPDVGILHFWMVSGHIERPHILADFETRRIGWHNETGNAARLSIFAIGAREGHDMARIWQASRPHLVAVDAVTGDTVAKFGDSARVHMRCV